MDMAVEAKGVAVMSASFIVKVFLSPYIYVAERVCEYHVVIKG